MCPLYENNLGRSNIVVVYDKQEALALIEKLKADGIEIGDIHIVGKDLLEFANLKWDAEINMHRIGNSGDIIKSVFTGKDAEIEGLKHAKLPEDRLEHFKQIIDGGGVMIYTDEYLDTAKIVHQMERDPNVVDEPPQFEEGPRF